MNQNEYITTSLALAAAIQLASKSKLLSIRKITPRQSSFIFNDTPELAQLIENFYKKGLSVDAFSYFETIKYIKARLYEEGGE